MKVKIFRKFLSISLIFIFILCGNVTVKSEDTETAAADIPFQEAALSDENIPEAVERELVEEKRHIARLYDKETELDTVVFANQDGTETAYIFDEAVKFVNNEGIITDKTNKLYSTKEKDCAYINFDNDIQTSFPSRLNADSGVNLSYSGYSIVMYPDNGSDSSAAKKIENDNEYVYYDKAFGQGTALRYKTTFSGFKEDIILCENVGNLFDFFVECGALVPSVENNAVVFTDSDTNTTVAVFDPVFVYDSRMDETDGSLHWTWDNAITLSQAGEGTYRITVAVDWEFLNNPDTVYPVYIDPSVTVTAAGSGTGKTIVDTPIYNGSGAKNITSGANPTAVLGYVGTLNGVQYGSGRLLMKFPGLMSKSFMQSPNYIINSADLYMKDISGGSASAIIAAYIYNGPAWTESSTYSDAIWNAVYKKDGILQPMSRCTFSSPNATTGKFNILDAVRLWQSNPSAYGEKGIMLRAWTSEYDVSYSKSLCTSEGSTKPYLSVTYTNRTVAKNAIMSYGASSKTLTIKLVGYDAMAGWQPIIQSSCRAWNDSKAKTNITVTTTGSSKYTMEVVDQPLISWYGLTTSEWNANGTTTSAKIQINKGKIGNASDNTKRSTVTHEIGHLFWLDDDPETNDYSLMLHARDRDLIYTPQMIDIYHMEQKYR